MPGLISTRSSPATTKSGQARSTHWQAKKRVPSDTDGAAGLAAKATAKWPMNTDSAAEQRFLEVFLDRLFAEPDAKQAAVEIFAFDRPARGLALDHQLRRAPAPVERDGHALFRLLHRRHGCAELLDARLKRVRLRFAVVLLDAGGERIDELFGTHLAQHVDLHALRSGLGNGVGFRIAHVQADRIALKEHALAHAGAGQGKLGIGEARLVVDLHSGHFGSPRRGGEVQGQNEEKEQPKSHIQSRSRRTWRGRGAPNGIACSPRPGSW